VCLNTLNHSLSSIDCVTASKVLFDSTPTMCGIMAMFCRGYIELDLASRWNSLSTNPLLHYHRSEATAIQTGKVEAPKKGNNNQRYRVDETRQNLRRRHDEEAYDCTRRDDCRDAQSPRRFYSWNIYSFSEILRKSPAGSEQEMFRLFRLYTKMYWASTPPQLSNFASDFSDPTQTCTKLPRPPNFSTRFPLVNEPEFRNNFDLPKSKSYWNTNAPAAGSE